MFGLLRKINLKAIENLQSLGVPNLIRHLGGWSPFPVGVVFLLTLRCNMKCDMCLLVEVRKDHTEELALDELKGVVDDLAASFLFKPFIHLIGGEPLLRRDLLPLVAYIKERRFNCSLTTNGFLLERHAAELVRLGLDRIHVSIDGPPEVHDVERQVPGAHDRAVAGIQALVAARQRLGSDRPAITINTVVTGESLPHLERMIPIAQTAGADALTYQHLVFDDCSAHDASTLDVEQLLATIPRLKQQARAAGLPITFFPHMKDDTLRRYYQGREEELNRMCVFPWYVVRVDLEGNITPCRGFVVDNVRTKNVSFRQVWNSPRFRQYRRDLARQGVFDDCGRCCHRQF
ncbi:MAG: radical SAM protein [Anaerolineae bacterium]|nr:radical SAM protein [Anaerolineae bacterium]